MTNGANITTRYYAGVFEYEGSSLKLIHNEEGRVRVDGTTFTYDYYLKDHLGNTMVCFTKGSNGQAQVLQSQSYYPFGMSFAAYESGGTTNRYLYNGKEMQNDLGLDWYDYGARFYDAAIGRWHSVDPHAEKYFSLTPYNYVSNNPIIMIDPDGKDGEMIIDEKSQRITIHAVYYVQTVGYTDRKGREITSSRYTSNDVKRMNENINKSLNKENLTVSEGEYSGYSVNYNLEFKEGGNALDVMMKAENDPIGNSIQKITNDKIFPISDNGNGTTSTTGGITQNSEKILMNGKQDNQANKTHEIFHTYGVKDAINGGPKDGMMNYPPNKVNQADVNSIVNNSKGVLIVNKNENEKN